MKRTKGNYGIYDSEAETKIKTYLEEFIDTNSYNIVPQQLLDRTLQLDFETVSQDFNAYKKIYNYRIKDNDQRSRLLQLDFVICNKKNNSPVLILEISGSRHELRKNRFYDSFKQFMCAKYNFAFIVLKLYQTYSDEEIRAMLLARLREHNTPLAINCYCPQCNAKLKVRESSDERKLMQCSGSCKNTKNKAKCFNLHKEKSLFFTPLLKDI